MSRHIYHRKPRRRRSWNREKNFRRRRAGTWDFHREDHRAGRVWRAPSTPNVVIPFRERRDDAHRPRAVGREAAGRAPWSTGCSPYVEPESPPSLRATSTHVELWDSVAGLEHSWLLQEIGNAGKKKPAFSPASSRPTGCGNSTSYPSVGIRPAQRNPRSSPPAAGNRRRTSGEELGHRKLRCRSSWPWPGTKVMVRLSRLPRRNRRPAMLARVRGTPGPSAQACQRATHGNPATPFGPR